MYIDPNTGGMLFQILAASLAAISGVLLIFSRRIREWFARMRRSSRKDESEENFEQKTRDTDDPNGEAFRSSNSSQNDPSGSRDESARSRGGPAGSQSWNSGKSSYETARQILGVGEGSSQEEIKKAYHELVKKYHPDKVFNLADEYKAIAEQKMKEINDAYSILLNKDA